MSFLGKVIIRSYNRKVGEFLKKTQRFWTFFLCIGVIVFWCNGIVGSQMVSGDSLELFQNSNLKFMSSNFFTQDDWVYDLIKNS
jgi:hypothetical protein